VAVAIEFFFHDQVIPDVGVAQDADSETAPPALVKLPDAGAVRVTEQPVGAAGGATDQPTVTVERPVVFEAVVLASN
jgi:hypothetical protein